jgi:hypothetical protein
MDWAIGCGGVAGAVSDDDMVSAELSVRFGTIGTTGCSRAEIGVMHWAALLLAGAVLRWDLVSGRTAIVARPDLFSSIQTCYAVG